MERVGWEDEDKDLLTGKTNEEERERPSIKKKEQKRVRAEFVQVRSKVLGPLEQKMSSIEKEIMDLEKEDRMG